ncbi:MAG: phosphoglycolate phosphatase [Cellvibrionaceae bacterium]
MTALLIFDLDGTLIDSVPDLAVAVDEMLICLNLPLAGEDRVRTWVGNGAAKLVERALHYSLSYSSSNTTESDAGKLMPDALKHFFKAYQQNCSQRTVLYPDVIETLSELKKRQVTMALVTNKPRQFVPPILQKLSMDHYFSLVLGGDDLPNKKPHPQPLLHCMETLGFSQQQTMMVGDSKNDVDAAKNANILVAAVDYGYNHGQPIEDEQPDAVLSNIKQVLTSLSLLGLEDSKVG